MTSLSRLQHDLQSYLLTGQCAIESSVVETETVSSQSRLNVYRNAYQSRLVEALANNFPCLQAYIGDEEFENIALEYIAASPSTYRSIRWFGDTFSDFLRQYYEKNYAYIAELAEFEWKLTLSFDARDECLFQLNGMIHIPPESWVGMKLILHPSVLQMNFLWNVVAIWEAIENDEHYIDASKNAKLEAWILWRHDYMNNFYALSESEAWALDVISTGATFGEVCEGLRQWHDDHDAGLQAASLLKGWIQAGLITNVLL